MMIHAQRRSHDCGVAALASLVGVPYEDMYVAAAAVSPAFVQRDGLSIKEMVAMAEAFGRPVRRVHWRKVDLDEDVGILGVNWHKSVWERHGARGHWVFLYRGLVIDPVGPSYAYVSEYLATNKGRAGTLLQLREGT